MHAGSWQLHCAAGPVPKMYDSHPQDAEQELQERGAKVTIGHHPETAGREEDVESKLRGGEKPSEVVTGERESKRIIELLSKPLFKYSGSERVWLKVVVRGLNKQQH